MKDISFHISVKICRELFSFLKNRNSLLACFTLSSLLLTFFKRVLSRRTFDVEQKSIIIVSETRALYFQCGKTHLEGEGEEFYC